ARPDGEQLLALRLRVLPAPAVARAEGRRGTLAADVGGAASGAVVEARAHSAVERASAAVGERAAVLLLRGAGDLLAAADAAVERASAAVGDLAALAAAALGLTRTGSDADLRNADLRGRAVE